MMSDPEEPHGPQAGPFPTALNVAMGIGIGGAVASSLLAAGLGLVFSAYLGLIGIVFLLYNIAIGVTNWQILVAMRRGSFTAWKVALVLVLLGMAFDAVDQGVMTLLQGPAGTNWSSPLAVLVLPAWFIDTGVLFPMFLLRMPQSLATGLSSNWLAIHLFTIQLPILLGLIAGRRWFRSPAPAVAAPSGSDGTPDAAF